MEAKLLIAIGTLQLLKMLFKGLDANHALLFINLAAEEITMSSESAISSRHSKRTNIGFLHLPSSFVFQLTNYL